MFSSLLVSVSKFAAGSSTPPNIHLLLQFDGEWDGNGVFSYAYAYEVDIPIQTHYEDFVELVRTTVPSSYENSVFNISYMSESSSRRVVIEDDVSLLAYLRLKSTYPSLREFPLCVEVYHFTEMGVSNGESVPTEGLQTLPGYDCEVDSTTQEETDSDGSMRDVLGNETTICGDNISSRYNREHQCPIDVRQGNTRQATYHIVAQLVKHNYCDATTKPYPPNSIVTDTRREHGIAMTYKKAWFAKEKALKICFGTPEESYAALPSMCYMLKQANPGSLIQLTTTPDHLFKYLFISLAAWREAGHGHCIFHILGNIKSNFNGSEKSLSWKFYAAARAASEVECERFLNYLGSDDPRIIGYLKAIGKDKWARSCSNNRYSIMTSNLAESMNNVDAVPREYPITQLVDFLVGRMQVWFHKRRELANATSSILTKFYEAELKELHAASSVMEVIAATRCRHGLSCYDYISSFYTTASWRATYSGIIHPIPSKDSWVVPDEVAETICRPPSCSKRPPGRPKKRRIPSKGEHAKRQTCSRCKSSGHNRKTCGNPISSNRV
ncbi:unnamed protein product [Cuscuta campestris]|uniref:MULE transposase domain-containing protein n=1 Tax=Cuscuta campestris TaxID=132261 RepID=A0A484KAB1_9ASTE|nr:unnamed protein product [Cuscuta campestris]